MRLLRGPRLIVLLTGMTACPVLADSSGLATTSRPATTRPAVTRPTATLPTATGPAPGRIVKFQPGIRIDWGRREVEVESTVVLREGLLELLACSPHIREHESVVRIEARPLHLFQALGLIGLTPGHPIWMDEETGEVQPAAGDPVEIDVRYLHDGTPRQEPIEHWARYAPTGRPDEDTAEADTRVTAPVQSLPWVFAGSFPTEDGVIAADVEGTVVAVVDFPSALIALPDRHSDRNEELWLEPNTPAIPPVGTKCTLVFRRGPLRIGLDGVGRVHIDGETLTSARLAAAVRKAQHETPDVQVRITIDPGCPPAQERAVLRLLTSLRVPETAVEVTRPAGPSASRHDPEAMAAWVEPYVSSTGADLAPAIDAAAAGRRLIDDLREQVQSLRARADRSALTSSSLVRAFHQLIQPPAPTTAVPVPPRTNAP